MGGAVDESLKCLFGVSCFVFDEHLGYENLSHFGFGTKNNQVEETVTASGLEIYIPSCDWLNA